MIPHFYDRIPGWFDFDDIYAERVACAHEDAVFVEVGAWLGRSTAFMATEIANSGKRIHFFAVDTWLGSPTEEQHQAVVRAHGGSIKAAFLANLALVAEFVRPLETSSVDAAAGFADGSIDFVFIDAGHEYEEVVADLRAWMPKVRAGGLIAGHDIDWAGVRRAVDEQMPGYRIRHRSWEFDILGDGALTALRRCMH